MEKELTEEEKQEKLKEDYNRRKKEYPNYKKQLLDILSKREVVEYAGVPTKEFIFREHTALSAALDLLNDDERKIYDDYSEFLDDDEQGFSIDGRHISTISEYLYNYQRTKALQDDKFESLMELKTAMFNTFGIASSATDLCDKLNVTKEYYEDCLDESNRVDKQMYQDLYESNLKLYLNEIKSNEKKDANKSDVNKSDAAISISYAIEKFDEFHSKMFAYHFESAGSEPDRYKVDKFAGLDKQVIVNLIEEKFAPKYFVKIDAYTHEHNHQSMLDNLPDVTKETILNEQKAALDAITNKLNNDKVKTRDDKVNVLLNAREHYLTINKLYYSYGWFARIFKKAPKKYNDACKEVVRTLSQKLDISEGDVKKFFNNKKPIIKINHQTYDYNKIYDESVKFSNELANFNDLYNKSVKVEANVDKQDLNLGSSKNIDLDLDKSKDLGKELKN